jgi:hypothetical protein
MINRTVKVLGWGESPSSASIEAKLDDELVFSGTVTLEEMTPDNWGEQTSPTLFTFEILMDFAGTKKMSIKVSGAPVRFGQIVANYSKVGDLGFSTGPDEYADVADFDSDYVRDPRKNIIIDGLSQEIDRKGQGGTWHWVIYPGSTFEHDLVVSNPGAID